MYRAFVRAKGHTHPLSARRLSEYRAVCDLWVAYLDGEAACGHLLLRDDDASHVRFLYEANMRLTNGALAKMSSRLNRYLHWQSFRYYRDRGFKVFDWEASATEPDRSLSSSCRWAVGRVVTTPMCSRAASGGLHTECSGVTDSSMVACRRPIVLVGRRNPTPARLYSTVANVTFRMTSFIHFFRAGLLHANARLNLHGRRLLIDRIQQGRPVAHVADELGISRQTAYKWWGRWRREGDVGSVGPVESAAVVSDPDVSQLERRVERVAPDTQAGSGTHRRDSRDAGVDGASGPVPPGLEPARRGWTARPAP